MDDLIPKLLVFPPVPAPAEPLSDSQYDQAIRQISQLLTATPTTKLASGLNTGEDVFDVGAAILSGCLGERMQAEGRCVPDTRPVSAITCLSSHPVCPY